MIGGSGLGFISIYSFAAKSVRPNWKPSRIDMTTSSKPVLFLFYPAGMSKSSSSTNVSRTSRPERGETKPKLQYMYI